MSVALLDSELAALEALAPSDSELAALEALALLDSELAALEAASLPDADWLPVAVGAAHATSMTVQQHKTTNPVRTFFMTTPFLERIGPKRP